MRCTYTPAHTHTYTHTHTWELAGYSGSGPEELLSRTTSGLKFRKLPVAFNRKNSGRMNWYNHGRPTKVHRVDTTSAGPSTRRFASTDARVFMGSTSFASSSSLAAYNTHGNTAGTQWVHHVRKHSNVRLSSM